MCKNIPGAIKLEPLYSISAVAKFLGVNPKTIRRWITAGDLPAHRFGRQWRISPEDLDVFVRLRRRP